MNNKNNLITINNDNANNNNKIKMTNIELIITHSNLLNELYDSSDNIYDIIINTVKQYDMITNDIIQIITGTYIYTADNFEKAWELAYMLKLDNLIQIKEQINMLNGLQIKNMTTAMYQLCEQSCIGKKHKCKNTNIAAKKGHLYCLKYLHKNGHDWHELTCQNSAKFGHLNCLQYAHENGCDWDSDTCCNAAEYGHLDCLKYAHENGCDWGKLICAYAAMNGQLDCLKYAHENGCDWDKWTCAYAAMNGQLNCLKYAHENGCDWDGWTCTNAVEFGHLDCLKYAHENNCPCNCPK